MTRPSFSKLLAKTITQLIGIAALFTVLVALFTFALLAIFSTPAVAQEGVNQRGVIVKAFMERVDDYVKLQKKIEGELPALGPTKEPSKVEAYQAAMAARIRLARPAAKRGDLFGTAERLIRDVVVHDGRTPRDERAAMEEVPPHDPLKVHATYPQTAPLATVPPLI